MQKTVYNILLKTKIFNAQQFTIANITKRFKILEQSKMLSQEYSVRQKLRKST